MTDQEKATLLSVVLRLIDDDQILTRQERRDLINKILSAHCNMTADDILAATGNNRKLCVKRGTTTQNDAYTGQAGEITMDTDTNTLRIHDGTTQGGISLARADEIAPSDPIPVSADYVVASQLPTAENGYTWYRKYKSGWVEQGGQIDAIAGSNNVNLPITMQDNKYNVSLNAIVSSSNARIVQMQDTSNTTKLYFICNNAFHVSWKICGLCEL